MSKKKDIKELRWVRLYSPIHIPRYLVEQVKDREYDVDEFFKYQELNCVVNTDSGFTLNHFNHLYALVNPENQVQGFLWFVIDPLTKDLIINTFSVDKAFWGGGRAVESLSKHVKEIIKKLKLKKVFWLTNYPKHSKRYGFKESRCKLMEYSGEEDGQDVDGQHGAQSEHQHAHPGATADSESDLGAVGTGVH